MLTLETITKDTIWVAKMNGWREAGPYEQMKHLAESDECRDFDIAAEQPEHLKEFYDAYFDYEREHGWTLIPDFYNNVWEQAHKEKRVWTEDEIKSLIQSNDKVLYRAIKKLYAEQTADEQASGETKHQNGVGFNGVDAKFMSSIAEFLNRAGFLTSKQKVIARKKLVKYNKQLTRLANA